MKSALESADSRIRRRENSSRRIRRGRRVGNLPTKFMGSLRWLRNRKKADRSARSSKGQPRNFTRRSAAKKSDEEPWNFLETPEVLSSDGYTSPASLPERVSFGSWTHLPKGVLGPRVTPL